ncbi:MAG TPA: SAM-dependent methyltransferase, partial [Roseovarius nubinhibens]|nr:SAM-dependent methyltransferase [Roseovarius nubinhibens]
MTPAARYQTAAEILDEILGGVAAEKALTNWARRARFAGSKDRAAVRDHVFDVLRQRQSCAARGGPDGRGLILGLLRGDGIDPDMVFTGDGYGPAVLSEAEREAGEAGDVLDLPAWIVAPMSEALGEDFDRTERALRERAPVMLRVNLAKSDPAA